MIVTVIINVVVCLFAIDRLVLLFLNVMYTGQSMVMCLIVVLYCFASNR